MRTLCALACALAALIAPSAAAAATINVNTSADVVGNDGKCSLREAITAANTETPSGLAPGECPAGTLGGDTIMVPTGDYVLTLGQLSVSAPITVIGSDISGTIIDADGLSRVFDVLTGASLTIAHATLTGGHAPNGISASSSAPGTPGESGGAIDNAGSLTLQDVAIENSYAGEGGSGSSAEPPGAGGSGGAIESTGPWLSIVDSTLTHNTAGTGGSASGGSTGGSGGNGGGIDATGGEITIAGSTIDNNAAGNGGSEAFVGGPAGNGGGLSLTNPAPVTVTNSTIANNHGGHTGSNLPPAGSFSTGGAFVQNGGTVTLTQVTVAGNTEDGSYTIARDISTTGSTTISASALDASCSGQVTDGGYNVAAGWGGCPGRSADSGGGSPAYGPGFNLGPLQDNGGPTKTMLPSASSALIDEVPASGPGCQPADQRGVGRPQGGACDAGSVERRQTLVSVFPPRRVFGRVKRGHVRLRRVTLYYENGDGLLDFAGARITGRNAHAFKIFSNGCRYVELQPGNECTLLILFRPRRARLRRATLNVDVQSLGTLTVRLVGRGIF